MPVFVMGPRLVKRDIDGANLQKKRAERNVSPLDPISLALS